MSRKIMLFIPFLALAGAEMMVKDLALGLNDLGNEVVVVSFYKRESTLAKELLYHNIRIIYLNKKTGFDITLFNRLNKLIKDEKPDVVHTHLNTVKYVMPCAICNNVSCRVHTVHNIAEKEQGKWDRLITRFYVKFFNLRLVAISPIIKSSILDEYRLSNEMIPMIYNGRNLGEFQVQKQYLNKENVDFLHVGRFAEQKNHIMMINAFADALMVNQKIRLILVGEGNLLDDVKKMVISLGIEKNVEFLGLRTDISTLMRKADVFLLPSKYEGMPITLIEAMASGLPIIATNVGGIPDMIKDQSGILIRVDQKELTDAILFLAESREKRELFGTNAQKHSSHFSNSNMAKEYMHLYTK